MGWRKWIVVAGVMAALGLSLGSIVAVAVNRSKAQACQVTARSLGLSLSKYLDTHRGCLPPSYIEDQQTGERHSCGVILLPNVTYDYIYGRYSFHEPWNGPHNRCS